jgi:predicted restriction endonuclease
LSLLQLVADRPARNILVGNRQQAFMRGLRSKAPRLRLDDGAYRELHRQVLQRDGWRCQLCGSMQRLQVHHLKFRGHGGSDSAENLITLCAACHEQVHRSRNGAAAL